MFSRLTRQVRFTSDLQKKLRALTECEENAIRERKQLEMQLIYQADLGIVGCVVGGDIGNVTMKKVDMMGVPSDEYDLKVKVKDMEEKFVEPVVSFTTTTGETCQCDSSVHGMVVPFGKHIKTLNVKVGDSTVRFDAFEADGPTHWLGGTSKHLANVEGALNDTFSGETLDWSIADSAETVSWLVMEGRIHDLDNKLLRLQKLKERIPWRHEGRGEDGWHALFGDPENLDLGMTNMRICTKSEYRQNDLAEGIRDAENVELSMRRLAKTRLVSGVEEIVDGMFGGDGVDATRQSRWERTSHVKTLKELSELRNVLVDEVWRGKPGRDTGEVVETRVKYLTLACVDAGLCHHVGKLCKVEAEDGRELTKVKLCRYQLRQIYANNDGNEIKLGKCGYETALRRMTRVEELCGSESPSGTETAMFNVSRRLMMHCVLDAIAHGRPGAPEVAVESNYMYRNRRVLEDTNQSGKTGATEMFMTMINADKQNRVITPLIHRYMTRVVEERNSVHNEEGAISVVGLFDKDIQPFVSQAVDPHHWWTARQACQPLAFLDSSEVRTGYNEKRKTEMLVRLMFEDR